MRPNSEKLFEKYLESNRYLFEKDYEIDTHVNNKNVDFKIFLNKKNLTVLADVKEIRNSPKKQNGKINADIQLKRDIKNLRQKCSKKEILYPVILITMNFSDSFFTGHTIIRAMYGELEVKFYKDSFIQSSELKHSRKGNAEFTKSKNTVISGIFVFNGGNKNNYFFSNYFAKNKIDKDYFFNTEYLLTDPYSKGVNSIKFNSIMI